MLLPLGVYAGPITIDGGVVFVAAVGQDADPSNSIDASDRENYPAGWGSTFNVGITEGRSSVSGDFGLASQSSGFQFDAFNVDAAISAGGPNYDPAVVVSDRASVSAQLAFTLTEATEYSIFGSYSGAGTSGFNNLGVSFIAAIANLTTSETVYLERKSSGGTDSLSYQFGDPGPNALTGFGSGVLDAGQYRFSWESVTADGFFSGGSLNAQASSSVSFQIGSYANVPEPSSIMLLLLSMLGLRVSQRGSVSGEV